MIRAVPTMIQAVAVSWARSEASSRGEIEVGTGADGSSSGIGQARVNWVRLEGSLYDRHAPGQDLGHRPPEAIGQAFE